MILRLPACVLPVALLAFITACSSGVSVTPATTSADVSAPAIAAHPASLVPVPGPSSSPSSACDDICYYVDANKGSDTNPGTQSKPLRTLNAAAALAKPGVTVIVASGTYSGDAGSGSYQPSALYLAKSGTANAWIKFVAAPHAHPVIKLPRGDAYWDGIQLEGVSYVLIDGFEVVGQDASITPAEGEKNNGSQGWLNESCILVDGVGYTGFHPPVPHDVVIRNNVVHDCSGSGIAEQGGDSITIAYNRIYDNSWWTVYGTSGLNIFHQLDAAGAHTVDGYKNFLVGNVVYGNHLNLPWIGANPPAITDGNGIIIDSNKHQDGGGPAYRGKTYIANNIVYGNGGRGVHVYESRNVDIVNNTTYNNMLSKSKYITCGEVDAVSDESVRAYNNIGVNLNGKQVDCTYDNVDVSYAYDMWSGKQIPVPGAHDILGNPELADPAKNEFTPRAGSPAIGSGTSVLAPALDFYAKPRVAKAIDRGAIAVTH